VSQENVDLVRSLHMAPDVDMAEVFRNDEMWSGLTSAVGHLFHSDFETVPPGSPHTERVYVGLDGFRAAWLGWLQPWVTYRDEIEQILDAGDRVLRSEAFEAAGLSE
jgi:ketosteroid isomerase-like protein